MSEGITPESILPTARHKFMESATLAIRGENRYPGGNEAEYAVLQKLYEADPTHVVRPLNVIRDASGAVVGYDTEFVDGQLLIDIIRKLKGKTPPSIQQQVRETLQKFHEAGLAHGDPNPHNVLVVDGIIKFFDPVGYDLTSRQEIADLQEYDDQNIKWLDDAPNLREIEEL